MNPYNPDCACQRRDLPHLVDCALQTARRFCTNALLTTFAVRKLIELHPSAAHMDLSETALASALDEHPGVVHVDDDVYCFDHSYWEDVEQTKGGESV